MSYLTNLSRRCGRQSQRASGEVKAIKAKRGGSVDILEYVETPVTDLVSGHILLRFAERPRNVRWTIGWSSWGSSICSGSVPGGATVPREYGPHTTIYNRFHRWSRQGVWFAVFEALTGHSGAWGSVAIDSTSIKLHRSAAGCGQRHGADGQCPPTDAIEALVADAHSSGARVLAGDEREGASGFVIQPTVLADVPLDAKAMKDEPFGPVALLRLFGSVDDAIEQANRLPFGLAAYCFTEKGCWQTVLGDAIESGMIEIN